MKYKCVGSNRATGARVTMELDANNRAIAERKASQAGMEVLHVEQMNDETQEPTQRVTHRGEYEPERHLGRKILLFVVLVGIVAVVFLYWARIRAMIGH
jgi:hypothetical protein